MTEQELERMLEEFYNHRRAIAISEFPTRSDREKALQRVLTNFQAGLREAGYKSPEEVADIVQQTCETLKRNGWQHIGKYDIVVRKPIDTEIQAGNDKMSAQPTPEEQKTSFSWD